MKALTIGIFLGILALTLAVTWWAARHTNTTSEFYAAGGKLTARANGFALAGDWMSAAAFLGFSGLISLYGMDGSLYAVAALAAFLIVLMVVAEPVRNTGRFTYGDVIAERMRSRHARLAAVIGTFVVNLAYMVPQMAGAGALIKLMLGISYESAVVMVGVGMIVYVLFGGMIATTWVQIIKAVLLLAAAAVLVAMLLAAVQYDPLRLFASVEQQYGAQMLLPGGYFKHPLDPLSLFLSFMFGVAGLPHIMTRFYTVPDARTARKSVLWLMFLAGSFFLVTTLIGFASATLVGQDAIRAADKGGNLALPLLAQHLGGGPGTFGGQFFLACICAVAFAAILAVVAGLTLASSGAIAHDLYVNVIRRGAVSEEQQVRVARIATLGVGVLAVALGLLAQGINVGVLVILAIAIAASANFPIILLSMFWRRFNTAGVIGGVTAGLVSSVALAFLGPAFLKDQALFPIVNPTILSMPIGFLGAWLGTMLSRRSAEHEARFDAFVFQAHTGARPDAPPAPVVPAD
ncbi:MULTISPECIES: cation acetate symporter [Burkholderiaceae]|jgi:cation/acetate symporter|uniref:Cation/acetate symporter n=8 Tax=Pseudomonadota TaxID=1224 RepID=J9R8P0_BURCE|nr:MULTISPECIES: cation acetate symporter [Burkholderiaceae]AFR44255.1 cation/acetate symporter [Burkholderia cepacia]AJW47627.1 symporter [Ralstonia mannitolilytica]AMR78534.1 cation acetate symporter [Cupriavidus nantongensis]MBU9145456.1 cation acetate symporter [Burkholderia multivorans]NPT51910.1 sodium/solute symporter [Ralstonia sp. 3N]